MLNIDMLDLSIDNF